MIEITMEQANNKLKDLKEIIREMNTKIIELINASAGIEWRLRDPKASKTELQLIEKRIEELINQYKSNIKKGNTK